MVGQISVFPDVGAAFFGSYRGARNQRLQESAMRAEMAAAQAERQRQAQAREAFARLQGPDQRIEQVQLDPFQRATNRIGGALDEAGIGYGEMPRIGYDEQRITPGLTPEQRAREEQRLAQADPNSFMAYRESRQQPDVDLSDIYDTQARRVDANPESMESAVNNAVAVAASRGRQVTQQQAYAEIMGRVGAPNDSGWSVREGVVNGQPAMIRVNSRTGEVQPIEGVAPRPRQSNAPQITITSETPNLEGLLRETDISGYRRDVLEGAQTQMSTAQNVLDTVADLNSQIEIAGGSTQGALGWARRVTSGAQGQIEQLAEYSPALAGMAQSAARDAVGQEDFDSERWFNDELGGADYLFHTLAYMVAKMRDDSGRVSDADMRNAISSLGGGVFGNDEQLASALRIVQSQAERRYNRALATEQRIMSGQDIPNRTAAGQGEASIEDLINRYAPEGQ